VDSNAPLNIPIARSGQQFVQNDRPDLAALVDPEAEAVLDVGCGPGQLGAELKARGVGRVVGIELNPEAARAAVDRLDEVLTLNVETDEVPLGDASFDYIVYGDVVEHLVDPWAVLRAHRRLLRDSGSIVVSTPNIGHWPVILDLLRGKWEYRDYGTMDGTHLRFFTRRSLQRLCEQAGYRVTRINTTVPPRSMAGLFNRLTGRRLEHLLVWRYTVVATPAP
jgi:methionine biosynthesis protein MetW